MEIDALKDKEEPKPKSELFNYAAQLIRDQIDDWAKSQALAKKVKV